MVNRSPVHALNVRPSYAVGEDYTVASHLVTVGAQSPLGCVVVMASSDGVLEWNEMFGLSAVTGELSVTVTPSTATVTILDTDSESSRLYCLATI